MFIITRPFERHMRLLLGMPGHHKVDASAQAEMQESNTPKAIPVLVVGSVNLSGLHPLPRNMLGQ